MTATATATAVAAGLPPASRKPPEISPDDVMMKYNGHCWREWQIRLPRGAILQDLEDPAIFRKVQMHAGKSLRKLDRVTIVEFNDEWIVEARVRHADTG